MPSLDFLTVDVFTQTRYLGNPLAIVKVPKDATPPTQEQKLTIAREFNLSETVFLHDAIDCDNEVPQWQVDIFTIDQELPFAGHPTIGTAVHVLSNIAASQSDNQPVKGRFKVKAGIIELEYADGIAKAVIPHNQHVHRSEQKELQAVISATWPALQPHLDRWEAATAMGNEAFGFLGPSLLDIDIVSPVRGMTFLLIQLHNLEALAAVQPYNGALPLKRDSGWDTGPCFAMFYVEERQAEDADGTTVLRTRMMAGSFEDPATGSASCALAAYLAQKEDWSQIPFWIKKQRGLPNFRKFRMVQGVEMGRRSEIGVEVKLDGEGRDRRVEEVKLIGSAVRVMEGKVHY
ncbi:hypothetical protein M8818_004669 [Zalaria obscura]|uniref:Uncharacterized protein n=1 Tax=Zalaria obscura TaxID=2024903 RepID=A0ACC3SCN4_9PEZI